MLLDLCYLLSVFILVNYRISNVKFILLNSFVKCYSGFISRNGTIEREYYYYYYYYYL